MTSSVRCLILAVMASLLSSCAAPEQPLETNDNELGASRVERAERAWQEAVITEVVGRQQQKARQTMASSHLALLVSASELFRLSHDRYPRSMDELMASGELPGGVPKDPWTNEPYVIELRDGFLTFVSWGADALPGGSGFDADLRASVEHE